MKLALVLKSRVIRIINEAEEVPIFGNDANGNEVTAIRCEDNVEIGMGYNEETNEFYPCTPSHKAPFLGEKILAIVSKSKEETENAAIDAFTEDLIEGGML